MCLCDCRSTFSLEEHFFKETLNTPLKMRSHDDDVDDDDTDER